jgi:hypothetical protein
MKGSRTARGFVYGSGTAFAAEVKRKAVRTYRLVRYRTRLHIKVLISWPDTASLRADGIPPTVSPKQSGLTDG